MVISLSQSKQFRFNPFDPEFNQNPYPTYAYLRENDPVHQGMLGGWVFTRYEDVKSIMRNPTVHEIPMPDGVKKKSKYIEKKGKNLDSLANSISRWLFFLDPPDHTKMRKLVSKAFLAQSQKHLLSQVDAIANQLIGSALSKGEMEVMNDYALAIPSQMFIKMLGLPEADIDLFRSWSKDLFRIFEPLMSLKTCDRMNQIAIESQEYFKAQIKQKKANPSTDLISALLTVEDGANKLTEADVIATCMMMFTAGRETVGASIGNSILALLNHPEQLELLKQNPNIIQSASEELMRYDSPTQLVARMATKTMEFYGKTIKSGDYLILCIGAANRDSRYFTEADKLDLQRVNNQHIAFATGIHSCLGAALARIEFATAINTFAQKLNQIHLSTNNLVYRDNAVLRCLKSLPIQVS